MTAKTVIEQTVECAAVMNSGASPDELSMWIPRNKLFVRSISNLIATREKTASGGMCAAQIVELGRNAADAVFEGTVSIPVDAPDPAEWYALEFMAEIHQAECKSEDDQDDVAELFDLKDGPEMELYALVYRMRYDELKVSTIQREEKTEPVKFKLT